MKRIGALLFMLVCAAVMSATERSSCPKGPHTLYSQRATDQGFGPKSVKSPDGSKIVTFRRVDDDRDPDGYHTSFTVHLGNKTFHTKLLGFSAEVLWSSDSEAFAVTETEGGGGIGYGGYVFYVRSSGLKKVAISPLLMKAFSNPAHCEIAPNIAIVDWLHGSDRILAVAETIPVSACECMGTYEAFEVSLPDLHIVRKYTQVEAKAKYWSALGCELRDADDTCATRLKSKKR